MSERTTVLVIDDDPGIREYLEALATRQGYGVASAVDGETALNKLEELRPDIITLDAVLPGMDGLETLRRIKQKAPEVPVIMLSGHGQARTIVEAMRLGASDFLRKPFEVEELELAFRKALENRALEEEVKSLRGRVRTEVDGLLRGGDNPKMREVREIIEQVADTDITVLVRGESGTGKKSWRVRSSSSGIVESPVREGQLRGASVGTARERALRIREGRFHGRTEAQARQIRIREPGHDLLDEISEMAPGLQAKLLQVLQDGEFSRLGGESDVRVDARIIAASNRNLEEAVRTGEFREDLYYRLNVVTIQIPPLRDRIDAVPLLVEHFLRMYNEQYKKNVEKLSDDTMTLLMAYHWPGNVRELENMIKRTVVLGSEQTVLQEIGQRTAPVEEVPESDDLDLAALGADFSNGHDFDLKAIRSARVRLLRRK